MDYKIIIENIMNLDKKIRFSVICDMYGNIVLSRHRDGLENFLTEDETKDTLQYSVEAWRIRHKHENIVKNSLFWN